MHRSSTCIIMLDILLIVILPDYVEYIRVNKYEHVDK